MRSLKTKKYARYYILLEECDVRYYNDYQNQKYLFFYVYKSKEKIFFTFFCRATVHACLVWRRQYILRSIHQRMAHRPACIRHAGIKMEGAASKVAT